MRDDELIFLCFLGVGLICGFIFIFMTFYLGRRRIKEIDRVVFGYEISSDSIFYQGLRLMDYGGTFAWRFYARRIGKEWMRERFDKKFQRPFIIRFWLMIIGVLSFSVAGILHEYLLRLT